MSSALRRACTLRESLIASSDGVPLKKMSYRTFNPGTYLIHFMMGSLSQAKPDYAGLGASSPNIEAASGTCRISWTGPAIVLSPRYSWKLHEHFSVNLAAVPGAHVCRDYAACTIVRDSVFEPDAS